MKKYIIILFLLTHIPLAYSMDGGDNAIAIVKKSEVEKVSLDQESKVEVDPMMGAAKIFGKHLLDGLHEVANSINPEPVQQKPVDLLKAGARGGIKTLGNGFATGLGQGMGQPLGQALAAKIVDSIPGLKTGLQAEAEDLDLRTKKADVSFREYQAAEQRLKYDADIVTQGTKSLQDLTSSLKEALESKNSFCKDGATSAECLLATQEYQDLYKRGRRRYNELLIHSMQTAAILGEKNKITVVTEWYRLNKDSEGNNLRLDHLGEPEVDRFGNPARYNKKRTRRLIDADGYPITEEGKKCPVGHDGKLIETVQDKIAPKDVAEKSMPAAKEQGVVPTKVHKESHNSRAEMAS